MRGGSLAVGMPGLIGGVEGQDATIYSMTVIGPCTASQNASDDGNCSQELSDATGGEEAEFIDHAPVIELNVVPGVVEETVTIRQYQTYAPCEVDPNTGIMQQPENTFFGDGLCDPGFTAYDILEERSETGDITIHRIDLTAEVLACPPVECQQLINDAHKYTKKGLRGCLDTTVEGTTRIEFTVRDDAYPIPHVTKVYREVTVIGPCPDGYDYCPHANFDRDCNPTQLCGNADKLVPDIECSTPMCTCDASTPPENGEAGNECTNTLQAGSSCTPVCDPGFELIGTRSCSIYGSLMDSAECVAKLCGPDERVLSNSCVACPAGTTNHVCGHDASGDDTECEATLCAENERVSANACVSCPAGTTNAAGGDDASGEDTTCDATLCAANERVSANACVACDPGVTNTADDDASGPDTECDGEACGSNQRVSANGECVPCDPGTTNPAGDDNLGPETFCEATLCAENERVSANACVSCPAGSTNDAGDDASGDDTACEATLCAADERVLMNECTACLGGSSNLAGDDASGDDTACFCGENERVELDVCVACPTGMTRPAGDPIPGPGTTCAAFACGENERVSANACVSCVGGSTNGAGDDAAGEADTYCACAENERVQANACVACDVGTSNDAGDPVPGDDTSCGTITCDASGAIENGVASPCDDALAAESRCDPSCDAGFELKGSRSCSLEGALNDTAVCDRKTCNASVAIDNGLDGDCTSELMAGSTCEPSCSDGYALSGSRFCSLEGALNDTAVCGLITCDASGAIDNGMPAGCARDLKAGSSCAPVCDAGFELTGSRSCDASGTLSDTAACAATSKDASEVAADALAAAESTRDAILTGVSAADQRKAKLLADLAIAGVKAKEIAMAIVADDADAACADALAKGRIRPDSDAAACDAELSGGGGGASGRRLRAASYDVTLTVNPEEVDDIALVETLAAEGVTATSAEVDPIEALGAIAGVDSSLLGSFEAQASAAVDTASAAVDAAAAAEYPPPPPAPLPPPPDAPLVLVEEDESGAVRRLRGAVVAAFATAAIVSVSFGSAWT